MKTINDGMKANIEFIEKHGYHMERSVLGDYWRLIDIDGNVVVDDCECSDLYDKERAADDYANLISEAKLGNIEVMTKRMSMRLFNALFEADFEAICKTDDAAYEADNVATAEDGWAWRSVFEIDGLTFEAILDNGIENPDEVSDWTPNYIELIG